MGDRLLSERNKKILISIVRTYIATGEPVGSERLLKKGKFGLSAATIRNIMAELEEAGYLMQPHTSAGRIPTDKGYRFYVDSLSDEKLKLSQTEIERINCSLLVDDTADRLMMRASHLLSSITDNIGIVLSPSISSVVLKHIEFVKLYNGKILVITVSNSGVVQNKIVNLNEDMSQTELSQASIYLVEKFSGKNLVEIKRELLSIMSEEKALYDKLLRKIILLCRQGLYEESDWEAEVYLDGASNLLNKPEFYDLQKMHTLFKTIEEKSKLVELISRCIEEDSQGIKILIGSENSLQGLQYCSLIACPYSYNDRVIGSMAVLGPTRMKYAQAISIVDYVAKVFGKVLSSYRG